MSSGAATTRFLYDGDRLVMEYDGSGSATRAYVHGPGVDEPLVLYQAGQRRFLHADHQGSIVALSDDSGAAVAINGYDEWGVPNPGNQGRFGYTGQAWVPELGLWYYKARFYSARLGRFLQVDPIGYEGGINLYRYAENDPVNRSDPSGELPPENMNPKKDWASQIAQAQYERQRRDPVRVVGGTAEKRRRIIQARDRVFTTPKGREMQNRATWTFQQERIRATNGLEARVLDGSLEARIDPDIQFSDISIRNTTEGPIKSSLEAVVGHELGHLVMGDKDDGPRNMNNVKKNENPIRKALNDPERMEY